MSRVKLFREKCLGEIPWGDFQRWGYCPQGNYLGVGSLFEGNCFGGNYSGVYCPGGESPRGNCVGWNLIGSSCPEGICPLGELFRGLLSGGRKSRE